MIIKGTPNSRLFGSMVQNNVVLHVLFQGYDTSRAPLLEASLSYGKPRSTHFIDPLARDEGLGQPRPRLDPRPHDREQDPDRNRTHDPEIPSPRADDLRYPPRHKTYETIERKGVQRRE